MLFQLLTTGIHNLKVAVQVGILRNFYPIKHNILKALNEFFHFNLFVTTKLLPNDFYAIQNGLFYTLLII